MKKAPTILQVVPWLDSGGVERGAVDIAATLTAAGACALVAAEPGRLVKDLEQAGGALLPLKGRSKNPFAILWHNARKIETMIRANGVDLVHARSRAPAWSALIAARRANVPFVTTYHGAYSQNGPFKAFYNSVMARGDVVIANSHYTARLIKERQPAASDRIQTIHRGVDLDRFAPQAVTSEQVALLRAQWQLDHRPVIILPSRLTRWKGQRFILPAVAALKKHHGAAFQLIFIGDEQGRAGYVADLDQTIDALDLSDCVKRVGHCADMPAAYSLCDLVIVPSQDAETFGRSAAEALAMGKPTLVGDLGAQPEVAAPPLGIKEKDWLAQVVPHGSQSKWAEAMASAIASRADADASLLAKKAMQARHHVAAHFSLQSMGRETLKVYDRLIGTSLAANR